MDDLEKIKSLEVKIAEQAAVVHYAGLRWLGFVVIVTASSLVGLVGAVAVLQADYQDALPFAVILAIGLLGGIWSAFRFRRTHQELKELEKEHLGMHAELAELRASSSLDR
jgi:hypothetical protein